MAVELSPEQRSQAVTQELEYIKQGTLNGRQWFYVRPDGKLGLYCKPSTIWTIICEWISRLFCPDKYDFLAHKVSLLTGQINDYLNAEDDPDRLRRFLWDNTVALNALFLAMFKLNDKHRIAGFGEPPDSLISQMVMLRSGKHTNFFAVRNSGGAPTHLQLSQNPQQPLYERDIKKGDAIKACLMGYPGHPWHVKVGDADQLLHCQYAAALYKLDVQADGSLQVEATPYRTRIYHESYTLKPDSNHLSFFIGVDQEHQVVLAESEHPRLTFKNESDDKVVLEIVVRHPSTPQFFQIKSLILDAKGTRDINFSDEDFQQRGIERGKEHFEDLAAAEQLMCVVRVIRYTKVSLSAQ
jgi:hypothetical protein